MQEPMLPDDSRLARMVPEPGGGCFGLWGPYQLRTAFQPIFSFDRDGKLAATASEGLLRPFRGARSVGPAGFFRSVPQQNRIEVEALARTIHIVNAGAALAGHMALFLNFNPSLFLDRGVMEDAVAGTARALARAKMKATRLVCEVTEEKSASESLLRIFASRMREMGCRIAVDDFGAADSDVERIDRLKPDVVKFDARWVTRLMQTPAGAQLLADSVARFAAHGTRTLFEGIEKPWQLDLARATGVDMVQGFGLGRPVLAPALAAQPAAAPVGPDRASTDATGRQAAPSRAGPAAVFGRRARTGG
jgi:EAL domain-containing protein (putative c-di-GMP-specific phosphodiesterase class I)